MNASQLSKLLFSLNIFNSGSWTDFFKGLWAFIGRIFYNIFVLGIGRIADICQCVFRKLAGLDTVNYNGSAFSGDIVLAFLQDSIVQQTFISLLILAVIILIITTFVATIKTEFNKDGNNNKKKVFKMAFRGLANFLLVPIICMFGIIMANALLKAVDGATTIGGNSTLSSQMFLVGAYNANRVRNCENNGSDKDTYPYVVGSYGENFNSNTAKSAGGYGNFGVFLDDDLTGLNPLRAADKIDNFFAQSVCLKVGTGLVNLTINNNGQMNFQVYSASKDKNYTSLGFSPTLDVSTYSNTISYKKANCWNGGAFCEDIYISAASSGTLGEAGYFDHMAPNAEAGNLSFADGDIVTFNIYNVGLVFNYYDLNIGAFDYLISTIALIFCAYTLLITALGLIKRLFMIVTLFIISAPICALYPLDDGKALGLWRGEFVKNVLSAYAVIIIMNLFLLILPMVQKLNLFVGAWLPTIIPIPAAFANYVARVLIVLGALTFFKDGTKTISGIIGAGDAYGDSNNGLKNILGNVGRAAAGVALAGGVAVGGAKLVGKGIVGAKNAFNAIPGKISQAKDEKFKKQYMKDHSMDINSMAKAQAAAEDAKKNGETSGKGVNNKNTETVGENNSMNTKPTPEKSNGTPVGSSVQSASKPNPADASTKPIDWHRLRLQTKYDKKNGAGAFDKRENAREQAAKSKEEAKKLNKKTKYENKHGENTYDAHIKQKEDNRQARANTRHEAVKMAKSGFNQFKKVAGGLWFATRNIANGKASFKDSKDMFKAGMGGGSKAYNDKAKADKEKAAAAREKEANAKMQKDIASIAEYLKSQQDNNKKK